MHHSKWGWEECGGMERMWGRGEWRETCAGCECSAGDRLEKTTQNMTPSLFISITCSRFFTEWMLLFSHWGGYRKHLQNKHALCILGLHWEAMTVCLNLEQLALFIYHMYIAHCYPNTCNHFHTGSFNWELAGFAGCVWLLEWAFKHI